MAVQVKAEGVTLNDADTKVAPSWNNKENRYYDTYTTAGTETNASTIEIARVPRYAIIDPTSRIHFEALGSDTAIAIGDGTAAGGVNDAVKYAASTATTSESSIYLDLVTAQGGEVGDYKSIYLTVSGTGTLDADKDIHAFIYFTY